MIEKEKDKRKEGKHFANGVLLGFGFLAVFLGSIFWFIANNLYTVLIGDFQGTGIDNGSYVLSMLSQQRNICLFLIAIGFVSMLYGSTRGYLLRKET